MNGILSNKSNGLVIALGVLLVGLLAGTAMMAGGAAAQETTPTPTPESSSAETLADETVAVNNQTENVYLEVTNTSGDALNYRVYGVEDGITTQVDSGTISAAAGSTTEETFAVDAESYDEYRIVVEEDGTDADAESAEAIDIGTMVQQSASGGGAIFGGGGGLLSPMNVLIALLLGAAAYLLGLFDPVKRHLSG